MPDGTWGRLRIKSLKRLYFNRAKHVKKSLTCWTGIMTQFTRGNVAVVTNINLPYYFLYFNLYFINHNLLRICLTFFI